MTIPAALTYNDAAAKLIAARLRANQAVIDAGLTERIYPDAIPQKRADGTPMTQADSYPAIVYSFHAPMETFKGMEAVTLMTRPIFSVRAIGYGTSYAALSPIARAINDCLDENTGEVVDEYYVSSSLISELRFPSTDTKGEYRISGGLYEFDISKNVC